MFLLTHKVYLKNEKRLIIETNNNWPLHTDKRTDVWSRDFIFNMKKDSGQWAVVWAGLWNKRVWADYEQLLRPVFSLFRGQKNFLEFFWKHYRVRTEKLHNTSFTNFFFLIFWTRKSEKNFFFLGLEFEWNLSVNTWRSGTDYCWLCCDNSYVYCSHCLDRDLNGLLTRHSF